jgi:hypothetical protein
MMSDYILIDGDKARFMPSFGAATVVVRPGTLTGSGPATLNGKKLCVAGDESSVSVKSCVYTTPSYPIPGTGTLEIESLTYGQTARKTRSGSTAVLLVGGSFKARFMVQNPAKKPTAAGPVPDATPQYSGTGGFITTNRKFTGV